MNLIGLAILAAAGTGSYAVASNVYTVDTVTNLPEFRLEAPSKTDVTLLPLDVNIVTSSTIEKSTESSLLPILVNKIPGFFVTERGFSGYGVSGGAAGTVNIRGVGQGNKVLFLIDGQPQWAGVFGHSLPDTYVTNGVERVEVIKGPASLLYGSNAMGGAVNIITRHHLKDGFFGRARAGFGSFSTQKFELSTGVKYGKFSAMVAGAVDRSNGNRAGSSFWNANEFAQFKYAADSNWEVGTTLQLDQTHANNPGTTQSPLLSMWTDVSRGTASVYAKDSYGIANGGIQAFVSWGRNNVDDGYAPGTAPKDYIFHSTDYNTGVTLYQTIKPWKGNNLSLGVDFIHWGGHIWNTDKVDPSLRSSEEKKSENEVAGYLMMQQGFWDDILSVNGGVRLQHGSQYGNIWIPQGGLILKPYTTGQLKFSFSKGYRAPNIRELYLYPPHNPDLRPEYMLNYEVEYRQWLLNSKLEIGLALFFIDGHNIIQTARVDGRPLNVNSGAFKNKGFELDAAWFINKDWSVSANYSYLHTDNKELLGAPKNKLNAELSYTPGNLDLTLESNTIWSLYTGNPTERSNYSLLNLQASYTFDAKCKVKPYIKLDNILNRHYEILYGCPMPGMTLMGGVELRF